MALKIRCLSYYTFLFSSPHLLCLDSTFTAPSFVHSASLCGPVSG
jgi:hypothetical protein